MKVKYNGSVLNQAGTMYSAATFASFPTAIVKTSDSEPTALDLATAGIVGTHPYNQFDRYAQLSYIRNGLWNRATTITEDARGVDCLYVPTDPLSQVFYQSGKYQGTTTINESVKGLVGSNICAALQVNTPTVGSPISYTVIGTNMPVGQCIQIECYYNYEVIADPSVAPILRSNPSILDKSDYDRVNEVIKNVQYKMISDGKNDTGNNSTSKFSNF